MLCDRQGIPRISLLAAASVSCLLAAACSASPGAPSTPRGASGSSSASVAAKASGTADPLANMGPAAIAQQAVRDMNTAPSLTMVGGGADSGQAVLVDLAIKPDKGCTGTIDYGSQGGFKIIVIGTTAYVLPNRAFWVKDLGAGNAPTAMAMTNGRYLKGSVSDDNIVSLAETCDIAQIFHQGTEPTAIGKAARLRGTRVLPLISSDGVTYVTDTSKPYIVETTNPNGTDKIIFMVCAPVSLTAPPPGQVMKGSLLGF